MAATVIDGKAAAARLRASVAQDAATFASRHGRRPRLCVVIVGDNPASRAYVRTKTKMAAEAGLEGELIELPVTISTEELLSKIDGLNRDPHTHGILVQLPLPEQIDDEAVLHAILAEKDVDGFHPLNVGRLFSAGRELPDDLLVPCTPYGCLYLLRETLGERAWPARRRSSSAAPTSSASRWRPCSWGPTAPSPSPIRAPATCPRSAAAPTSWWRPWAGPEFIQGAWVKPGATVIDVGINRVTAADGPEPAGRRRRLRARQPTWPVRSRRSRAASAR